MNSLFEQIWAKRFVFLGTFFLVFTLSYVALLAIDFLPEPKVADESIDKQGMEVEILNQDESIQPAEEINVGSPEEANDNFPVGISEVSEMPLSISIEKLGKTVSVLNPTSRTISDLDTALLGGVVRHPDSATLSQDGNVFILGHSSYLPNVINKNFQAFNGIQKLEWGDMIEVFSADMVYEYRVEKVYRARAKDVTVPIAGTEKLLTLATCNSFGSVDDRYVVEAKRVGAHKI